MLVFGCRGPLYMTNIDVGGGGSKKREFFKIKKKIFSQKNKVFKFLKFQRQEPRAIIYSLNIDFGGRGRHNSHNSLFFIFHKVP